MTSATQPSPPLVGEANRALLREISSALESGRHVIVFGESGAGKSTLLSAVSAAMGVTAFDVLDVKASGAAAGAEKQIKDLITRYVLNKSIDRFFLTDSIGGAERRRIVVLDDSDIHLRSDRTFASFLSHLMFDGGTTSAPAALVLMTCACGTNEEKRLKSDFARKTTRVSSFRMVNPTPDECVAAAACPGEEAVVRDLAEKHGGNIGAMKTELAFSLARAAQDAKKSTRVFPPKATGDTLLLMSNVLSADAVDHKTLAHLGNTDFMLPLLMYENAPKYIRSSHLAVAAVVDAMIDADVLEQVAYRTQDWSICDLIPTMKLATMMAHRRPPPGVCKSASSSTSVLARLALNAQFGKKLASLRRALAATGDGLDDDEVYGYLDTLVSTARDEKELLVSLGRLAPDQLTTAMHYLTYVHEEKGFNKTAVSRMKRAHARMFPGTQRANSPGAAVVGAGRT